MWLQEELKQPIQEQLLSEIYGSMKQKYQEINENDKTFVKTKWENYLLKIKVKNQSIVVKTLKSKNEKLESDLLTLKQSLRSEISLHEDREKLYLQ